MTTAQVLETAPVVDLPPNVKAVTCGSVDAWRRERVPTIGGSDLSKLFGVGGTPLELYADKVMALDAIDAGLPLPADTVTEQMELGNEFEPTICRVFGKRTGLRVVDPPPFTLYRNDKYPWLHASPDRFIFDAARQTLGVLEAKSTGGVHNADWEIEAPLRAQVQIQSYELVLEMAWGWIAGFIGTQGWSFKHRAAEADASFQSQILEESERFVVKHLKPRVPPAPSAPVDTEHASRLFRRALSGKSISLPASMVAAYSDVEAGRAARSAAEVLENLGAALLKLAMADAEVGILPDGRRVKWANEDAHHEAKPAHVVKKRVLRLLKPETAKKGGAK